MARTRLVGTKRAHVQIAGYPCFDTRCDRLAREFCVSEFETSARETFFIEDADEIDDDLAAGDDLTKFFRIVDVGTNAFHVR